MSYDDVATLPRKERLEKRTRALARIGGLISDRRMAAIREAEGELTRRVLSIFDDVDVVITPAPPAARRGSGHTSDAVR